MSAQLIGSFDVGHVPGHSCLWGRVGSSTCRCTNLSPNACASGLHGRFLQLLASMSVCCSFPGLALQMTYDAAILDKVLRATFACGTALARAASKSQGIVSNASSYSCTEDW